MNNYHPVFQDIKLGIGTWAWGDRLVWGYGNGYTENEIQGAFQECLANGVLFFDTAEVYGQGKSEAILGRLSRGVEEKLTIATKMMPFPWRLRKGALRSALSRSMNRLQIEKVDLYQMHWPLPPVRVETWMDRMADAHAEGKLNAIGVSNYNLEQTRCAHEELKKRGLCLASNQVEYHLLERRIETTGLMSYCESEGIKIIAYSPLAMGVLSGKYSPENPPKGTRAGQYNREYLKRIQPLIKSLIRIGNEHEGKTAAQVAINWVIQKNALPIPGAKNANQAAQNCGALGWNLNTDDVALLDEISAEVGKT